MWGERERGAWIVDFSRSRFDSRENVGNKTDLQYLESPPYKCKAEFEKEKDKITSTNIIFKTSTKLIYISLSLSLLGFSATKQRASN